MFVVLCPVYVIGFVSSRDVFLWKRNRPVYSHGTTVGWEGHCGSYPAALLPSVFSPDY
jgi:hypothetical protein